MESVDIKVHKRTDLGKKAAKKLRKQGMVPGVLYGGEEVVHFYAPESAFKHIIYTDRVYIVNLDIDGKVYKTIRKATQFHPVTDRLLHIDFLELHEGKPVKLYVPVKLTGFAEGVRMGGNLFQLMRYMRIKALPKHLPDHLEIDVTNLGLGKSLKVEQLSFENIEILEPKSAVVAVIKLTRAAKSKQAAEAEQQQASS